MINGVCTAVLVAISLAFCPTTNGQYFLGCPPVDDVHDEATILPNPFNCSTFYICAQGTPLLFVCPGHLQFNYELQVCDYPERANCFELQQYPEPVTTYVPVAETEAGHVHADNNPEPVDKAAHQPTKGQVELTPEHHTEQPQETAPLQSHSNDVPSELPNTPVQTSSYDEAVKEMTDPTEPIGTPEPQPLQEQSQSERREEGNAEPDESGIALVPLAEAHTTSVPQPQPTENPTEQAPQEKIVTSAPTDDLNPVTASAPESQPQPSRQKAEPTQDSEANEDATQLHHELEPTSEASTIVTDSEPQLEERPAETEQDAQIAVEQVEPADERERPLSQTSPVQALQTEPLPTEKQIAEDTALSSADFQPQSTDAQQEVPEPTDKPAQREPQPSDEQSEAVDDTTKEASKQTVRHAQESSGPETEPTAVAPKFELEATEEPAGFFSDPSELLEEQQSSRDVTKLDNVAEDGSTIEAEASEKPLEGPYEFTEKSHQPAHTQQEAELESQSKLAALESEPDVTGQPTTRAPAQSETQAQVEPTQQPEIGLEEASPKHTDVGGNLEESATELDQSEQQATPKSAEAHTQIGEVADETKSAPETEPHKSESNESSVEQLALNSDASSEAGSQPQAHVNDTPETIGEPRSAQAETSKDTQPLSPASNEAADSEATEQVAAESAVTEVDSVPFEDKVHTTSIEPVPESNQHNDSSAIGPNDLHHNRALQPSDGVAPESETASLVLAPTEAAERVPDAAEPTRDSSAGSVMGDSESNMGNLQRETTNPPGLDSVDAAYEEKIRSDAVEIDYYS